ncbi:MAG: GNAT family N-acetyltransferase [Actinomycetota bacterium]|nr:GNAT family N-acetyltransferase [Actinomycetota bacterium]
MKALIRPAVPGDAAQAARLSYMAGQSHLDVCIYDLMFPGDMERRLEMLGKLFTTKSPSWFHYSHHLVADVDGEVAGSLCGYFDPEAGGRVLRDAYEEAGMGRRERREMAKRLEPLMRVYPVHGHDIWVVENVAVFPRFRRKGLLDSLLDRILQKGRDRGFKRAELRMLIGNIPAQKAYEKAGFRIVEEFVDTEFEEIFGCPGMARMVVDL